MNKLKDILYTIVFIIYFCLMTYSFVKGNTDLLILSSTFYIYTVITAYYDGIKEKLEK